MEKEYVKVTREELEGRELSPRLKDLVEQWLRLAAGVIKGYTKQYVIPWMEAGAR